MNRDYLGNELSHAAPEVLDAINDFVHGFLSYQNKAVNIMREVDAYPDCVMANTYAGFLWMFLEAPNAPQKAAPYLARAQAACATRREAGNVAALAAWVAGDIPAVIAACEEVAKDHPTDLALIKIGQYHLFNGGDAAGMLRLALRMLPECEALPYVHGMIAFGYEQCHLLQDAEAAARRGMQIQPDDPWSHHAMAHVMLTQGRVDEGISFLEEQADGWHDLNSFMHTHNWWHLALFYISKGRSSDVLRTFDRHVWAREKSYSQDQVGAVSLLARMEFAGIDVGERWADVVNHVAARGIDLVSPFLTLQYFYALSRCNHTDVDRFFAAITEHGASDRHDARAWAEVAVPTAKGIMALHQGRAAEAVTLIGQGLPRMAEIGGSHAQRDLFEQIHLAAMVAAGQASAAQQVLEMRRTYDPDGVPLNRMLADIYRTVGLPEQAEQAAHRAAEMVDSAERG